MGELRSVCERHAMLQHARSGQASSTASSAFATTCQLPQYCLDNAPVERSIENAACTAVIMRLCHTSARWAEI